MRCLPLTTLLFASAAAPPPPLHVIVDIYACRTRCGGCAECWEERFAGRWGGCGPTGVNQLQARASRSSSTAHPPPLQCAPLSQERQHRPCTKQHTRDAGRGAARHLGAGGTLPRSAPFAEPRPLEESLRTALSSQHCLMIQHRFLA